MADLNTYSNQSGEINISVENIVETSVENIAETSAENIEQVQTNFSTISASETINTINSPLESEELCKILTKLSGAIFGKEFIEDGITVKSLKYLKPHHLDQLCPAQKFGHRVIFEHNLLLWQNSQDIETASDLASGSPSSSITRTVSASSEWIKNTNFSDTETSCDELLNVAQLCRNTPKGQLILTFSEKDRTLSPKYRRMLGDIIVQEIYRRKINATPKYLNRISDEIIKVFPKEDKSIYFIPVPKKKPKGILYAKYHNYISKLRTEGLLPKKIKIELKTPQALNKPQDNPSEDIINYKKWLQYKTFPESEIHAKWIRTAEYRLNSFKNPDITLLHIFKEWPLYEQSFGHSLINIDFGFLFPSRSNLLVERMDDCVDRLLPIMQRDIKDNNSRQILMQLQTSDNLLKDTVCVIIFILLHSLLVPTLRFYKYDQELKKSFLAKATINDSKDAFLCCIKTSNDYKNKIDELRNDRLKNKDTLQPIILAVGKDYFTLTDFYVFVYNVSYKLPTFVEALDVCFKEFHVFDLRYPKQAELVWTFIQKYFFDISNSTDVNNSSLAGLLSDISEKEI